MLLLYPLSVLATNRALDTIISRKPKNKSSMYLDLLDTFRIGKFKALYAGIIPTIIFTFLFTGSIYKKSTEIKPNSKKVEGSNSILESTPMPPDSTFEAYRA